MKHAVLMVPALIVLSSCNSQGSKDLDARLEKFSADSNQIKAKCLDITKRANALHAHFLQSKEKDGRPYPPDQKTTRQVLELVEEVPDPSTQSGEFLSIVRSMAAPHAEFDLKAVMSMYSCNPSAYMDLYYALLEGEDRYGFGARDKKRAAEMFFHHASEQLARGPMLIQALVFSNITSEMIRRGWVEVSDPIYLALSEQHSRLVTLRTEVDERLGAPDYPRDIPKKNSALDFDGLSRAEKRAVRDGIVTESLGLMPISMEMQKIYERLAAQNKLTS